MLPDNKRDLPTKITFAPLIPLSAYVALLEKVKIDHGKIINKITSIKEQKISNIFYLPRGGGLKQDYIALFDELYTMPSKHLSQKRKNLKSSLYDFLAFIYVSLNYQFIFVVFMRTWREIKDRFFYWAVNPSSDLPKRITPHL